MIRPIQQSVTLSASPAELFDTFLDSKKHSAITNARAHISRKVGGRFTAFNGQPRGRTLLVVPKRLIVQAWRSSQWKTGDPDSILILQFSKAPRGGTIDLLHVNVPAHDRAAVSKGWRTYYWTPWRRYLAKRTSWPGVGLNRAT